MAGEYHKKGYDGRVVWVPLGDRGLEPNTNPSRIPSAGLIQAESVVYSQDSLRKMGGTQKISAFFGGSPSSVALGDWWPSDGMQRWVRVATNGTAYLQTSPAIATGSGQNGATSALGPTALTRAVLVTAGGEATELADAIQYRKFFIFTGTSPVHYYDGASPVTTAIASPAEDWSGGNQPVGGCLHNSALWAFGPANRPHGLYRSRLKNHAYFASELITAVSTQFFTVMPGVGQRLWSARSHKGLLFLFKYPFGVGWLDDSDVNPGGWRLQQLTDSVGCAASPYATVLLDDGIIFMTPNAEVYMLAATTQGGVELVNLSSAMNLTQWLKDNINTSKLHLMSSCWHSARKQAIFSVAQTGQSGAIANNLTLYFDFANLEHSNGQPRFSYSTRDAAQCLGVRKDMTTYLDVPCFGTYAGTEYQIDQVDRCTDRQSTTPGGYVAAFQIPHTNLVEYTNDPYIASMNKIWDFIDVEYIPIDSMGPLRVTTYVDGTQTDQFTLTLTPIGNALDDSTLGLSAHTGGQVADFTLASRAPNSVSLVRHRITGEGRRISVTIEQTVEANAQGDDFNITGVYFSFRDGGQDVGRNVQVQ